MKIFLIMTFIFLAACNGNDDNLDGSQDNFKFSEDQLGILSLDNKVIDYGKVVLENEKKKYVEIENTGRLPLIFGETKYDGKKVSNSFFYSGPTRQFPGEGGDCPEQLESGEKCIIAFSYLPLVRKSEEVEVQVFYNNGLREDSTTMTLKGYGGERASIVFSLESVDFPISDQLNYQEISFTLTNEGGQIADEFSMSLTQTPDAMMRELFAFVPSKTTCPMTVSQLDISEECTVTISSTVHVDQEYANFIASFNIDYQYDPNQVVTDSASLDIIQQVVSIEGIMSIPVASLDYGNVVNGHITEKNFLIQNTGYKDLSVETITISGDGGSASVDITDCTERSDERYNGSGKLLLGPNESCIFALVFSPNFGSLPFDFSGTDIFLTYDDGKNGIQTSDHLDFTAVLVNPADIIIVGAADPHLEPWAIGNAFIANDTRFNLSQSYTIKNVGDVLADATNIVISGSPYYQITHDCPIKLAKDAECTLDVDFTPVKSIYDVGGSLVGNATITIGYEAGDSVSLGVPNVSESYVQPAATLNNLPQLVFDTFDTTTSGSTTGVAGSSSFYDVVVKNVGVTDEANFDLSMTNSTDYFIVDDVGLTDIGGNPNCAHLDSAAGVLASGALCAYRIRAFSAATGDISTDLTIDFQGGAETSDIYTYAASFVGPAKLSLENPIPITKARIKSYPSFNYPGVGSSTSIHDGTLQTFYSGDNRAIDPTKMNFPVLPGPDMFDFAYVELGYSAYGAAQNAKFDFKNIGEFEMEVRSMSIGEVFNTVTLTDVTASNYFALDTASCTPSPVKVVAADATCSNSITYTIPDGNLYRVRLDVTYTLGDKVTPISETFTTYTSSMLLYVQGYNPTSYAVVEPSAPAGFVSDEIISLSAVFGGDNSDSDTGTLQNTSTVAATDIHYAVMEGSDLYDLSSGPITSTGLTAAGAPIANYYRLNIAECSGVVVDEMGAGETCNFGFTYAPVEEEEKEIDIFYRYHNGLTYEEGNFKLQVTGVKPANLVVQNLTSTPAPSYIKDFGEQVVEGLHAEYVEIKNEGGATASNVQLNVDLAPFYIRPNDDGDLDSCGATIDPDAVCYIKLEFNPTYAHLEITSSEDISFSWENGVMNAAVPDVVTTTFNASGFAEEKYTAHQGWTSVKLSGYNQPYADYLEANVITKPGGGFYGPHELGLVEIKWNAMADVGTHPNPIASYAIYKNETGVFDVRNDTPYASIPYVMGQDEYTFLDDDLDNLPGKVWFYHIIPIRNGNVSKIILDDYPESILRAVIPNSYSIGLHKHMAAMLACKKMGLDINDPANIDLANNGCLYTNSFSEVKTFRVEYDTHMDMFEAGISYSLSSALDTNAPGDSVATATVDEARGVCQGKRVSFDTTNPGLGGFYYKDLPNRREHFYLAEKSGGYTQADCQIVDNDIITGNQVDCRSDFELENMAGGLPEWTLSQVDGYGKGITTELPSAPADDTIDGINFKTMFTPSVTGTNKFDIASGTDPIGQRCFNAIAGVFAPKSLGDCNGDQLLGLSNDPDDESPTVLYLGDDEPAETGFEIFIINDDISGSSSLSIFSLAGGGDKLSGGSPKNNYSAYTTNFTFGFTNDVGYRCVNRVGY